MSQNGLSSGMIPAMPSAQSSGPEGMSQALIQGAGRTAALTYQPTPGVRDEMIDQHGALRPHWQKFFPMLERLGTDWLPQSEKIIERLLRDHGATYNAFQDTGAAGRPWSLDALPVLLSAPDFDRLASGMQQRVRLFRAILQDAYGPQRMLHEGWIPPRLLFANPGFLRPVIDIHPGDGFLFHLATDLVRGPDNTWLALGDRSQMPSGLGYSLENRIVLSQVYSREINGCRVHRLAEFFERARDGLRELAPPYRRNPNVVMVTPGPHHRGYFEHAFKARYLGFTLVESADLTVRDRRVFLKTLEGLRQVDVVIRRMEDRWCDSLELESDTVSGIPGLIESWRSGKVSIANGIGSGMMEAPAWLPFLPALCRHLLGEDILIPSVNTWWCGQKKERQMVLADPRRWVFKRAFLDADRPAQMAANMPEEDLQMLLAEIRTHPEGWVAQEAQRLSTTPTLINGCLQPRPFILRSFATGSSSGGQVMPGGLGRVSPEHEGFLVTMNAGARSKDVWILSDGEVNYKSLLGVRPEVLRVARPPGDVPSRIADHLFWVGRYAERLEQTSRVLRMLCQRLAGEGSEEQAREMNVGLLLAREIKLLDSAFDPASNSAAVQEIIHALLENPTEEGGVPDLINRLRFNAAAARDRLSDDTWQLFNRLLQANSTPLRLVSPAEMIAKLDRIILDMAAFSGMQQENMVQGHGWRFLEIGRRIERAWANALFNQAAIVICEQDDAVLRPMLEIFDSTMTYRRHHLARPKLLLVLDLLMLNAANPRSLHFQLAAIHRQISLLPAPIATDGEFSSSEDLDSMLETIAGMDLQKIGNTPDSRQMLAAFCKKLSAQLEKFSDELTENFFSHTMRRAR